MSKMRDTTRDKIVGRFLHIKPLVGHYSAGALLFDLVDYDWDTMTRKAVDPLQLSPEYLRVLLERMHRELDLYWGKIDE